VKGSYVWTEERHDLIQKGPGASIQALKDLPQQFRGDLADGCGGWMRIRKDDPPRARLLFQNRARASKKRIRGFFKEKRFHL
jgi:hypothetical protein